MTTDPATSTPLPPFYKAPTLLRFPEHRLVGLYDKPDYGFAREAAAIPILGTEFVHVQRSNPIVFSNETNAAPLAVTGLLPGQNLCIDAQGRWAEGDYVPSYVRRYPFIGMTAGTDATLMLGADLSAVQLSTDAVRDGARPLFLEAGGASETARSAMALCEAYAVEHERSRAFGAALEDAGLLVAREARVVLPDGAERLVQGFRMVDEGLFRALSGEALATFHANGWTDLIILHLASQQSWNRLAARAAMNA